MPNSSVVSSTASSPVDKSRCARLHPEFEAVYDAHVDFVRANARRLGVDEASADDVVQRVFIVVHKRLGDFEHRSSLKTWLFGILVRVVREERRSLRRRLAGWLSGSGQDPDELACADATSPFDALSQAQANQVIQRLLDCLAPDKREVFVLAELEEMTAQEIAEITGLTPSVVYTKLRAARTDFERAASSLRRQEKLGAT